MEELPHRQQLSGEAAAGRLGALPLQAPCVRCSAEPAWRAGSGTCRMGACSAAARPAAREVGEAPWGPLLQQQRVARVAFPSLPMPRGALPPLGRYPEPGAAHPCPAPACSSMSMLQPTLCPPAPSSLSSTPTSPSTAWLLRAMRRWWQVGCRGPHSSASSPVAAPLAPLLLPGNPRRTLLSFWRCARCPAPTASACHALLDMPTPVPPRLPCLQAALPTPLCGCMT